MPRVHAVVVYHGAQISRVLVDAVRRLPPYLDNDDPVCHGSLRFTVHLEDLSQSSEEQIVARDLPVRARLALLFLQHLPRKDPDQAIRALLRWQPVLHEAFGGDGDEEEFGVFAAYALQVTEMDPEELQRLVERMLNTKRGEKVMYTADRLRLEGRKQGLDEGSRTNLLHLLRLRFGDAVSHAEARIQSATLEQVFLWFDRAALAATLDDMFREG